MSKNVKHLFSGFIPKNYTIILDPDRDTMKISGSVKIIGQKVGRPSQRLTFHQNGLKITSASVIKHDKKGDHIVAIDRINHHRSIDEVRLHSSEQIYPGSYTVTMEFEGKITRPMEGIYPCFFKQDNKDKMLIATQFESHHARNAFPCIDEPEAKASFDLTLVSPTGETVIGNTPIKSQKTKNGKLYSTFETTPHMSTYLLAFVYGDLRYLESKTKHDVLVRTYATPDNVQFTKFALDIAVKCLELYNDYFDIPYPLPKCDLIALPDFAAGAMENWGCITFREHALIVDPSNTSLPTKQYVAMVVAHELAHQWFGNLVTMRWWTDLWLNEGFANWMEYFAPNIFFPDWQLWTQYIVDEQQPGLKLDALENTHPVQSIIKHPDEIRSIFDAISYNKGGSSLQMLAQYLGPDIFRDGLRYYLKKYSYKNTDTVDLWDALEFISHKPVKNFMNAWTTQAGYPLLRATVTKDSLHLEQERFLLNPVNRKDIKKQVLWPIPLNFDNNLPEVFESPSADYKIKSAEVLKLNHDQSGFYRVVYNPEHLKVLANRVSNNDLGPLDRLGLLADAFEAAKSGYSPTDSALLLIENYKGEDNNAVWDIIASSLSTIRSIMDDENIRNDMKPYTRKLVAKQLERLGWEPQVKESYFDSLLRPTILSLAAVSDEPKVVAKALEDFEGMDKAEDIPPDLRGIIYCTAARKGNEKTFKKLLKLYYATNSSEERVTLSMALTNFEQPELISQALDLIMTESVRLQDVIYWVAYSFSNRHSRAATWEWMTKNWKWLEDNLGNDMSFTRLPVYAARVYGDSKYLRKYIDFFESVSQPSLERSIKQGIEMIEWQSAWKARDLESIQNYFAKQLD
jgi:aminopeptidase N